MKITLCPNKSCHKGKVVTKEVYHCRFVLDDCPVCNGKGFVVEKKRIIKWFNDEVLEWKRMFSDRKDRNEKS